MNEKELTKRQTEMHDKIFNHANALSSAEKAYIETLKELKKIENKK